MPLLASGAAGCLRPTGARGTLPSSAEPPAPPIQTALLLLHRYSRLRHVLRDGSEPEGPKLRRAANADEELRVLQPVRLSSFLDTPQAQALLGGRGRGRGRGR
jgi:hypothetical protein